LRSCTITRRNANINFSQEKISQKVELFVKRFKMDNPENAERNKTDAGE
jgi:hypothetical protein